MKHSDLRLVVGGFTPLTTIDYPGKLAAVIFLQGCPWRCGYCQNRELIPRSCAQPIPWNKIISTLEQRIGLLDGVVFSGGEPTLHTGLPDAVLEIKSLGFKIGLHTAGIYPRRLTKLLPMIDWVGLDIKSAHCDYGKITSCKQSGDRAWESARIIVKSGIDHEIRTTVHPEYMDSNKFRSLLEELTSIGVSNYVLQDCVTSRCLDEHLRRTPGPSIVPRLLQVTDQKVINIDFRDQ